MKKDHNRSKRRTTFLLPKTNGPKKLDQKQKIGVTPTR